MFRDSQRLLLQSGPVFLEARSPNLSKIESAESEILRSEFVQVTHLRQHSNQAVCIICSNLQVLPLSIIDLAPTPLEHHAYVSSNRGQRSPQIMCDIGFEVRSHLKENLKRIPFFDGAA